MHGLDEALRRGEQYLKAGVDGIFIEAPQTVKELEIHRRRVQRCTAARQHAGRRPDAGFAAERTEDDGICDGGLPDHADFSHRAHHRARTPATSGPAEPASNDGVNFAEFKDITNYDEWARIEDAYAPGRAAS